jgi:hypothetical protein
MYARVRPLFTSTRVSICVCMHRRRVFSNLSDELQYGLGQSFICRCGSISLHHVGLACVGRGCVGYGDPDSLLHSLQRQSWQCRGCCCARARARAWSSCRFSITTSCAWAVTDDAAGSFQCLLNPGVDYHMQATDVCYVLARDLLHAAELSSWQATTPATVEQPPATEQHFRRFFQHPLTVNPANASDREEACAFSVHFCFLFRIYPCIARGVYRCRILMAIRAQWFFTRS